MARATNKGRGGARTPPRRPATPAAPPREPITIDHDDTGDDDYITPDAEFMQFLEEYDPEQGGEVRVYRESEIGKKEPMEFLARFAIPEFDPVKLQHPPFNGGRFRIHVRSRTGIIQNFPFRCAAIAPPAAPPAPIAPPPAAAPAPELLALLDGLKVLTAQIATLAAPRGGGMGVEETIRMMTALQGFAGNRAPAAAPAAAPADPLDMLQKFLELQKVIGGDRLPLNADGQTDDGAIFMRALEIFGRPLAAIAEQHLARGALPPGAPPPGEAPAALPAPAQPKPAAPGGPAHAVPSEEEEMNIKVAVVKPIFILAARSDADVTPYVEILLDHFSDEEITKYIDAPDWKAAFLKLMPEAADLMPWFERLRTAALAELTPEPPGSTIPPGGSSDGSGGNAGT